MSVAKEHTRSIRISPSKRQDHGVAESSSRQPEASHQEIFNWTMTAGALAPCHVRDIHTMRESDQGPDFFWLGRVPCRTIRIVGLVVGITVYESRIIYILDDGTGVIECNHKVTTSRHQRPPSEQDELPTPIAQVGDFLVVAARVVIKFGERHLLVNEIDRCKSANDELLHHQNVRRLHQDNYSLVTPFVVPEVKVEPKAPETPRRRAPAQEARPVDILQSSPVSVIASSPVKYVPALPQSPPRLRHPKRLRSEELTTNAFRIYVKHFMDNEPSPQDSDDPFATSIGLNYRDDFDTPKASTSRLRPNRPSVEPISLPTPTRSNPSPRISSAPEPQGYTVSYLRRVPELAFMAQRVLRQQQRIQLKKLVAAGKSKSQLRSQMTVSSKEVKRLFNYAIGQLYQQGSIVIWTGSVKPCRSGMGMEGASRLWKDRSERSADMTAGTSTSSKSGILLEDEGDLSDPEPNEEAYIPLKTSYLADKVAEVIPRVKASVQRRRNVEDALKERKRVGEEHGYFGVTVEQITRSIKRDDQWKFLSLDSVQEAVEHLEAEDRAWAPVKGQWDLTM